MPPQPAKVVSVAQMQALEAASERAGVSRDALMENAGLACARRLRQRMGGAAGRRVVVLVGPGNNGADGLVAARCLRRWGAEVCCYVVRSRPADDPKMTAALAYDIAVLEAADDPDFYALAARLARSDLIGRRHPRRRTLSPAGRHHRRRVRPGQPPSPRQPSPPRRRHRPPHRCRPRHRSHPRARHPGRRNARPRLPQTRHCRLSRRRPGRPDYGAGHPDCPHQWPPTPVCLPTDWDPRRLGRSRPAAPAPELPTRATSGIC